MRPEYQATTWPIQKCMNHKHISRMLAEESKDPINTLYIEVFGNQHNNQKRRNSCDKASNPPRIKL